MRLGIVIVVALMCSGCGACGTSPLQKEYNKLAAEQAASDSASAETLYDKAEKFTVRVGKTKGAPKGLLAKARALQQERARQFTLAAAKNWDLRSSKKVLKALLGSDLNPEIEVERAGITPAQLEKTPMKKIDPTDDNMKTWK